MRKVSASGGESHARSGLRRGPVGLLAAYSSLLRGAAEVYVVDAVPDRLDKTRQIGAIPIDFRKGNPMEQIRNMRLPNPLIRGAMRKGEEKMAGVMSGIDAIGYQAKDFADPSQEMPTRWPKRWRT